MSEFIFKHNLDEILQVREVLLFYFGAYSQFILQMERDSQGFLMALSSSSFTKSAAKIQSKPCLAYVESTLLSNYLPHRNSFLEYAKLSQNTRG